MTRIKYLACCVAFTACVAKSTSTSSGAAAEASGVVAASVRDDPSRQPSEAGQTSDSMQVLSLLGAQLRADYRGDRLLFGGPLFCQQRENDVCFSEAFRRMVDIVASAARGERCPASGCSRPTDAFVIIYLDHPRIGRDTTSILLEVQTPGEREGEHVSFTRYTYVLIRPVPLLYWRMRARLTETSGHYVRP
jgi:hypothetical protein